MSIKFQCQTTILPHPINEELKEMCYLDPGMLSKGRRYIDLRRWIAKSLALSKTWTNFSDSFSAVVLASFGL